MSMLSVWALTVISVLFQAGGLAAAAVGFRQTFQGAAAPGERFFRSVLAREAAIFGRWRAALTRSLRRFFRRPTRSVTGAAHASLGGLGASVTARGYVSFGPLPDLSQDAAAFTAEVEHRLNRVMKLAQEVQADLRQEEQVRDEDDRRISSDLDLGRRIQAD